MINQLFVGSALLFAASIAQADAVLDFVDAQSGKPQTRLSIAGPLLRVDIAGTGSFAIINPSQRTLTQVNVGARAYTTTSVEQVQAIIRSISGAADPAAAPLMQLAMENMPEQQRAQFEQMLRQSRADEAIPYVKTGKRAAVLDIPCTEYQQQASTGDLRTLCAAAFSDLKLSSADQNILQQSLALLRETGGPWVRAAQVPGIPIRYSGSFGNEAYQGGGRLQTLSSAALPASRFAIPPDYRIVSILEMLSMSSFGQ